VRQLEVRDRFCDTEINHDRQGRSFHSCCHEYVGWFDVPMDDSFLMRVLNGLAYLGEKFQPVLGCQ
jgi:hypothetical protein